MDSRNMLIALSIHFQGNWHKLFKALLSKEWIPDDMAEGYLKCVKSNVITILDSDYPNYLRQIYCPPFVLFYYGDISLLFQKNKNIAVVGGRSASKEGLSNAHYIVSGVAKKYNIVSGLAVGIDTIAHKGALESGGKTIAVLANGIEYCYPSNNEELYDLIKKKHLVISEYYGYLSPEPEHFHQRNRLIAGISCATIIGEAKIKSGTSITAGYSLANNNDILCLPSGDIFDSLNNLYIRDGCPLVLSPQDVFDLVDGKDKTLLCEVK